MLRPERMSKVSVTGSKVVLSDVIGALYGLSLIHVTDYDGSWDGFTPGNPLDGAEDASDKLVTVRSIESILDLDRDEVGPATDIDQDEIESRLEDVRTQVNDLDDRRDEIESDLEAVQEELERTQTFVDLGIDLDLLSGYDTIQVQVGEADEDEVRAALEDEDAIEAFETWATEGVVAVFAYPADNADETALEDALVGVEFASLEVPDSTGNPNNHVEQLVHRRQQLASRLDGVENEIESVKLDAGSFLVAAEETLTRDVQQREVPLEFATTERSFVAEGWVPTERYPKLESALADAVGDHVAVDELERASYEESHHTEEEPTTIDEASDQGVAADGGVATDRDQPPVIQDNPGAIRPFELLVETINRPRYFEFDPTVILFLTFPVFFGFMIGDLGYGILYTAVGWWLYSSFDSDAIKSLGGIALWAGGFTALFGILYGEIFGLHQLGEIVWGGHPPIEKGLSPASADFALTWLVVSVLVGLAHMTVGYLLGFIEEVQHSFRDALLEKGSWVMLMVGVWLWIFSTQAAAMKPAFLFTVFDGQPFSLGFAGFSAEVGTIALGIAGLGLVLMVAGEVAHLGGAGLLIGALESLKALSDALSYTRIAAVLLAKAGMAFVVNLLFFGVYVTGHGEEVAWHFGIGHMPEVGTMYHGHEVTEIMFGGLVHSGVAGVIGGLLILVIGHLLVLALGITSAGLQAVRLEYVEFFGKFYEGGGEAYEPFGYDRA